MIISVIFSILINFKDKRRRNNVFNTKVSTTVKIKMNIIQNLPEYIENCKEIKRLSCKYGNNDNYYTNFLEEG